MKLQLGGGLLLDGPVSHWLSAQTLHGAQVRGPARTSWQKLTRWSAAHCLLRFWKATS